MRLPCSVIFVSEYRSKCNSCEVMSANECSVLRMSGVLEIEIPNILLFLNQNRNSQNSPKRMYSLFKIGVSIS